MLRFDLRGKAWFSALAAENYAFPRITSLHYRILLIATIAGGIFFRVYRLMLIGYNTDEAVYAGQAAAIAGVAQIKDLFPIFRAHPLLFQFILSLLYHINFNDLWGRLLAAAFGIGTVYMSYRLGKLLYGEAAGVFASMIMAFMPYHVSVSRQVLLDGPETFFALVTIYMLAHYSITGNRSWLYATGASMGLTFLSKETAIILLGSVYAFLALARHLRVRIIDLAIATVIMSAVIAPFPISLVLAGGRSTGKQYLAWQLFRHPNHDASFYITVVPPAIGLLVILAAVLGLWLLWKERSWRETLLISWLLVPVIFFQLWPVKGYQYLLPTAPAIAVLAARFLSRIPSLLDGLPRRLPLNSAVLTALAVMVVVSSLANSSWKNIHPSGSTAFLAGTGGVPGGREAGEWVLDNAPEGAIFMTLGPSMANIIKFYGRRDAYGLSVSPNPLYRNPSYTPINNPDLQIRRSEIQYLVWDSYSAARSSFFSEKLLMYVERYNGRVIHTESVTGFDESGHSILKPVIVIYEVRP